MPRGTISIQDLVTNGGTVGTPWSIDATNGGLIQAKAKTRRLVIQVKNTAGAQGTLSLVPGANPPAFRQGMGTATVTVPATTGERFILVESARFAQANGDIYLDFSAGMTGSVNVYRLPGDI